MARHFAGRRSSQSTVNAALMLLVIEEEPPLIVKNWIAEEFRKDAVTGHGETSRDHLATYGQWLRSRADPE